MVAPLVTLYWTPSHTTHAMSHRTVLHPHARSITGRVRLTPLRSRSLSSCPVWLHHPCGGREGALHGASLRCWKRAVRLATRATDVSRSPRYGLFPS
jgi:hypothetical protein